MSYAYLQWNSMDAQPWNLPKNKIPTPVAFYFHPSIGQIFYLALTNVRNWETGLTQGLQGICAGSRRCTPEGKVASSMGWQLRNDAEIIPLPGPNRIRADLKKDCENYSNRSLLLESFQSERGGNNKMPAICTPPQAQSPHSPQNGVIIPSRSRKPKTDGKGEKHNLKLFAWQQNWFLDGARLIGRRHKLVKKS